MLVLWDICIQAPEKTGVLLPEVRILNFDLISVCGEQTNPVVHKGLHLAFIVNWTESVLNQEIICAPLVQGEVCESKLDPE